MQNALREHSAILLTSIKLPFVFKTFVFSIFEWSLKTGFSVLLYLHHNLDHIYIKARSTVDVLNSEIVNKRILNNEGPDKVAQEFYLDLLCLSVELGNEHLCY